MALFDLDSPKSFFDLIERRWRHYASASHKHTEDILFVVLGLNHLREWIAPGYPRARKDAEGKSYRNWDDTRNANEVFSRKIYENPAFSTIRALCNGTKHVKSQVDTTTTYRLTVSQWSDLASIRSIAKGPPSGFYVEGTLIDSIIEAVLEDYRAWFARP